jgi:hypothetical protein
MSQKQQFQGEWGNGRNTMIQCKLPVIIFEEEGNTIVFCAPLDLSGYGANEEEAKKSWEAALDIYFDYTMKKGSLADDLRNLGWEIRKSLKKKLTPPSMSYLLERNEDFRNIFDNYDYRQQQTTIEIPALA